MTTHKQETYLVFIDSDLKVGKLFKKGFGHILIVANDGINWIVLDVEKMGMKWEILALKAQDNPFKENWGAGTVVKMNARTRKKSWLGRIGVLSCVLWTKYYLGLKCRSLTPYQLFKHIIKNGSGELVHGYWW